ncbi:NAD(P)-binding domain-containing protein [Pseudobacillus sp. FSL P4-0506]|uniref:NAD(P)-binding domain-containing protein n=1 Tax=unclassified Pseudobacillus TaxID=2619284 RepID=UPI0030F6DFDD
MRVGLIGIGKLGMAMMKHWSDSNQTVAVYHPDKLKAEKFVQHYQHGQVLMEKDLLNLDILVLALPAKEVIPFIEQFIAKEIGTSSMHVVNMATTLYTKEVKHKFPHLSIYGVKFMGHSRELLERGNGLFIAESPLPSSIQKIFQFLGEIKQDSEERLVQVNKLATYHAVKTALDIEREFTKKELDIKYVERALTSIAPEVLRSYSEGTLGHFGREVAAELQRERRSILDRT